MKAKIGDGDMFRGGIFQDEAPFMVEPADDVL